MSIAHYRPYQRRLHLGAQEAYREGHRQILCMSPTASGKTVVAGGMIARSGAKPGKPALFIVPRITLCDQAAQSFTKTGLSVSILQSDHPAYRAMAPVQICSVQTLTQRGLPFSQITMIIVDEAHIRYQFYWQLRDQFPDIPMIGLTATPTARGLAALYSTMVVGGNTGELVSEGWLMPSKVFEPCVYDTAGVDTVNGEFNQKQLWEAVQDQREIHGDVVGNWLEHGENRPTLCFPVNKRHSMEIVARFINEGIEAAHIQDTTPLEERKRLFNEMRAGRLKVISSVGCLTEGLDLTLVSCLIFARPVKSLETHIQMWGRGLRPKMIDGADGQAFDLVKRETVIFDHGGNTLRLMHCEDYAPESLNDAEKGDTAPFRKKAEAKGEQSKCSQCDAIKPRGISRCPYCRHMPKPVETGVAQTAGELTLTIGGDKTLSWEERQRWYRQLLGYARIEAFKDGWAAYAYKEKTGAWPAKAWQVLGPLHPDDEVQRYVKYLQIKRAKSRQAA